MDKFEMKDISGSDFLLHDNILPIDKSEWKEHCEEEILESPFGPISVHIQGKRGLTPIVTLHDLGLNGPSQFASFFAMDEMRKIMGHFCAYHITAPGQQECARTLTAADKFPNVDEMADIVDFVIVQLGLQSVIGFGVGMGAHIMAKTALFYPAKFIAIVVINCVCTAGGWGEWANAKLAWFQSRNGLLTHNVLNNLIIHHLGYESMETRTDLVSLLTDYFRSNLNPINYTTLLDMYSRRTQLAVERNELHRKDYPNFSCPVMNVTSDFSPYLDDAVEFNGRLDPANSTFIKLAECGGLILGEQPNRFAEAFLYFLQGMGYVTNLSISANAIASRTHMKIIQERISKSRSKTICMASLAERSKGGNQQTQPNEV